MTKVVKSLLIINTVAFIIVNMLGVSYDINLALYPIGSEMFNPIQLITYMFLHASVMHIVFNMLALVVFGPELERSLGEVKFLIFYLLCGIAGGLANSLLSMSPVIGASAAVWGVLVAYTILNPNQVLYLYFILPVKAKYIIGVFFALELYYIIFGASDNVSHIGHVGGAVAGLLLIIINKLKR